jgi:hypothetical protein
LSHGLHRSGLIRKDDDQDLTPRFAIPI